MTEPHPAPRRALRVVALVLTLALVAIGTAHAQDPPPAAAPSAKELVAKLASTDAAAAAAAADALVALGESAVLDLVAAIDDPALRAPALGVIERLGPAAWHAAPRVTLLLNAAPSPARGLASRALGAIGAAAEPAVPRLGGIAAHAGATDRNEAADAFRAILVEIARRPQGYETPRTKDERAIELAAGWLLRHRAPDGSWGTAGFKDTCKAAREHPGKAANDLGVTGLATLALLGLGSAATPETRDAAKAGLARIVKAQGPGGSLGGNLNYVHAVAGRALAEGWLRTRDPSLREPLVRAVAHTLSLRSKSGGWRYDPRPGGKESDTSVTCWMATMLDAAERGGIAVKPEGIEGAVAWVLSVTDADDGKTGYQVRGSQSARTVAMQDKFPASQSEAMTACGVLVRLLARNRDKGIPLSVDLIAKKVPRYDIDAGTIDFYYWKHGYEVMRAVGGKDAVTWRKSLRLALTDHQIPEDGGCAAGTWICEEPWLEEGGQVYLTAMGLLALEAGVDTRPELTTPQREALAAMEAFQARVDFPPSHPLCQAISAVRAAFK